MMREVITEDLWKLLLACIDLQEANELAVELDEHGGVEKGGCITVTLTKRGLLTTASRPRQAKPTPWAAGKLITHGHVLVENEGIIVVGHGMASIYGQARAVLSGHAIVDVNNEAKVKASGHATAILGANAEGKFTGHSRATLRDHAKATLKQHAQAWCHQKSQVTLSGSSMAWLYDHARGNLSGYSHAIVYQDAKANAADYASISSH